LEKKPEAQVPLDYHDSRFNLKKQIEQGSSGLYRLDNDAVGGEDEDNISVNSQEDIQIRQIFPKTIDQHSEGMNSYRSF